MLWLNIRTINPLVKSRRFLLNYATIGKLSGIQYDNRNEFNEFQGTEVMRHRTRQESIKMPGELQSAGRTSEGNGDSESSVREQVEEEINGIREKTQR